MTTRELYLLLEDLIKKDVLDLDLDVGVKIDGCYKDIDRITYSGMGDILIHTKDR